MADSDNSPQISSQLKITCCVGFALMITLVLMIMARVGVVADYHVSTTDDSGAGSLRLSITDANNGDTIIIDAGAGTVNISSLLDTLDSTTFYNASGTRLIFDAGAGSRAGWPTDDYALKFEAGATLSGALPGTVSYTYTGSHASVICVEGDLTLADDLAGTISGNFGSTGYGLLAYDNIILQNDFSGSVEITSTNNSAYGFQFIRESLSVTGDLSGSVEAKAGTNTAYGFFTEKNITISGSMSGTVFSEAGGNNAYGFWSNKGGISITNDLSGDVTARAGQINAHGLYSFSDIQIGGNLSGTVSANSGTSDASGMKTLDNLTVSGAVFGTVTAETRPLI